MEAISYQTVRRALNKDELKPWPKNQWCIPPEASGAFVWRLEDVLDVYTRPYYPRFPQVCLDEVSKQLLRETRPAFPGAPGRPRRVDHEYERAGVVNLFLCCEPLRGRRRVSATERRTKVDWAHEIQELVEVRYPDAERIVLVPDNLNTDSTASLYDAFPPEEAKRLAAKLEIHYTPKHGSWLNMAEIELSVLSRQCLDRRVPDLATLTTEVAAWQARRNAAGGAIHSRFTNADSRIKLKRLYPSIEEKRSTRSGVSSLHRRAQWEPVRQVAVYENRTEGLVSLGQPPQALVMVGPAILAPLLTGGSRARAESAAMPVIADCVLAVGHQRLFL